MAVHTVRRATADDLDGVAATLADAFSTDPVMAWIMGARLDSDRRLLPMFRSILDVELAKAGHTVELTTAGGAAAIWHQVDDWKMPVGEILRAAPAVVRTFGPSLPRALWMLRSIEKVHPSAPHVHLAYLGVSQDRQGRGLGTALLAEGVERLDREGLPAYLENSNPRNEALYVRHGFESRGPIALPAGAPPLVAMWRDPR